MNAEVKNKLKAHGKAKRAATVLLKDITPEHMAIATDELKERHPDTQEAPLVLSSIGQPGSGRHLARLKYASPEQVAVLRQYLPSVVEVYEVQRWARTMGWVRNGNRVWEDRNRVTEIKTRILFDLATLENLVKVLRLSDETKRGRVVRSAADKYIGGEIWSVDCFRWAGPYADECWMQR